MPAPDLVKAKLTLTGGITTASYATFLGHIGGVMVVDKPIAGERPLWDFPSCALATERWPLTWSRRSSGGAAGGTLRERLWA